MHTLLYASEKLIQTLANTLHRLRIYIKRTSLYSKKQDIKLDLGSGGRKKKGFVGIDAVLGPQVDIEHNLESSIPFPNNSVYEIYSSHLFEHISHRKVEKLIKECFRVLTPNGKITIEVPDLEKVLERFLTMNEKEKWGLGWEWIFGNQKGQFEFHKTGFTKKRLLSLLKDTGFAKTEISNYKFGSVASLRVKATKPL